MPTIADEIQNLYKQGISLLPVRENKVPVCKWKDDETGKPFPPLSPNDIFDLFARYGTESVAMVMGEVSGRLLCLDIDTKNYAGFDAILLKDLKTIYPDVYPKFRIEKTPSGGFHILYRIGGDEKIPGVPKLASRKATDAEILSNAKEKYKCFLEVRCEGGLSQCYPSKGYTVIQDVEIQTISYEEHASIMEFCKLYDQLEEEKILKEAKLKVTEKEVEFYSVNPFEDFDHSPDGEKILTDLNWEEHSRSGSRIYYMKPNKKAREVSAAFDRKKRLYTIFTTATEIENKSYTPSNLYAHLNYNGDKKQLYAYLVSQGFGKIKKDIEKNIAKVRAANGQEMPQNASDEAKEIYKEEVEKISKQYPFGIFWNLSDDGTPEISQMLIDKVLIAMGFRIYMEDVVVIDSYTIKRVTDRFAFVVLLNYIGGSEDIYNAYVKFIDKFGKATIKTLSENGKLETERILESTKFKSYKFYQNCYVEVSHSGIKVLDYFDIGDRLIFEDQIINRNFNEKTEDEVFDSYYYKYLDRCLGVTEHLYEVVGYLTHDFLDDSMNSIIMGTEEVENPNRGGGSGKNIFFNLLNHASSVHVIPAVQAELNRNLLQSFNYERILVISDAPKKYNVEFFKEFSSGTTTVKRLYKNVVTLERKMMPKPVILTNFSFEVAPGLSRRIVNLEFKEFFSLIRGGVSEYFGIMFPGLGKENKGDWSEHDFNCFDNFVLLSIYKFMKAGKLSPTELSKTGWIKQFRQNQGHLYEFIKEHIDEFIKMNKVKIDFIQSKYETFCKNENIIRGRFSMMRINEALESYCNHYSIDLKMHIQITENTIRHKGHQFDGSKRTDVVKVEETESEQEDDMPF